MARTRQQAKQRQAKRREKEQRKAQGTTGQKPPSNPAEQAAVQQAEAYEVGDVLEESGGDSEEAAERLDDELSDAADTPEDAALAALARTGADGAIVTIYLGHDTPAKRGDALSARIRERFPTSEVEVRPGGQPFYDYLISVE